MAETTSIDSKLSLSVMTDRVSEIYASFDTTAINKWLSDLGQTVSSLKDDLLRAEDALRYGLDSQPSEGCFRDQPKTVPADPAFRRMYSRIQAHMIIKAIDAEFLASLEKSEPHLAYIRYWLPTVWPPIDPPKELLEKIARARAAVLTDSHIDPITFKIVAQYVTAREEGRNDDADAIRNAVGPTAKE